MSARLFIAVDLSVAVVERLSILQRQLASRLGTDAVEWVDAPNVHVTLKFLGSVDEALIPMISETLTKLARPLFPFEVSCCRIGAFPDLEQPRIIWAGLDERGAEVMGLLRQTIERDLGELGFAPDEREYLPHVTLGRVRDVNAVSPEHLREFEDLDFGASFAKDLGLFESRRTDSGAEYLVRRRFALGEVS